MKKISFIHIYKWYNNFLKKLFAFLFFLVLFMEAFCITPKKQELTITGIFLDIDTVVLALKHGNAELEYLYLNVEQPQEQTISCYMDNWLEIRWFHLGFRSKNDPTVFIKRIEVENEFSLDATKISELITDQHNVIISLDSINKELYCKIAPKDTIPDSFIAFTPYLLYQSRPIGFQLFLRLAFCISLLFLIAFLFKQTTPQKFLIVSIGFFVATLPLKIDWSNWTLGLMGLVSIISFIIDKKRQTHWHPIFWLPIIIFTLLGTGMLYAVSKENAYAELDTSVNLIIFPVIFSIFYLDKKNIINLLHFFIRVIMIFCLFGLLSYITNIHGFDWSIAVRNSKLFAPLMLRWPALWHPSIEAIILLMAIPIALYLRYEIRSIALSEFLLCIGLTLIFPVLTGARIGIIVAPLLIGMGFLYYSRKIIIKIGLVVIGGICLFLLINNPSLNKEFSDPIRDQLRITAIDAIKTKPLFGWGTGSMKDIIESTETATKLGFDIPQKFNHFHNQYLDMAVQLGVPGLLLIIALFGCCIYLSFRNKDFILLSFVLLYTFCMMVESPWSGTKGIQPFMFWLCFLVSTQTLRKH